MCYNKVGEKMKDTRVVFMGTPDFSVPTLKMLIEKCHVVLVVTQKDAIVGRKKELKPSPIKEVALAYNIEVFQPTKIKEDFNKVIEAKPDLIVTCAYGQIIPKELLELPALGCINVHASLLPKLRGGAPIHRAIMEGHIKTGITIMYMDEHMDNGDIISTCEVPIQNTDNVGFLHDILSLKGSVLLSETLPSIINRTNSRIKQNDDEATFAKIIKRQDELIDFNRSCVEIYNQIRGLNPWPLAYFTVHNEEVKVLECDYNIQNTSKIGEIVEVTNSTIGISCKDGVIYLVKIKPASKKEMFVKDYLNGVKKEDLMGVIVNEK